MNSVKQLIVYYSLHRMSNEYNIGLTAFLAVNWTEIHFIPVAEEDAAVRGG